MLKRTVLTICISTMLFVFGGTQLFAQSTLNVSLSPQFPRVGENLVVTIDSYVESITTSNIRWEQNGVFLKEGIGLNQISLQVVGDTELFVTITGESNVISQRIPIVVSEIDVLWQVSNSYTPPFYKGKALPTEENSVITAVAIANRSERDSLIYRWQKNDSAVSGEGGVGKNSFSFTTSVFDDGNTLRANVSDSSGSLSMSGLNTVSYVSPEVVFYEYDFRLGTLLQKVIKNNHTVSGETISIVAVPFFLSTTNIFDDVISMKWSVRGQEVFQSPVKNRLNVSIQPGQKGVVPISLFVEHAARIFEKGTVNLNLNFK